VIPFDTEAEAIRIANGTNYGLASSAYRDIKKATSGERDAGRNLLDQLLQHL